MAAFLLIIASRLNCRWIACSDVLQMAQNSENRLGGGPKRRRNARIGHFYISCTQDSTKLGIFCVTCLCSLWGGSSCSQLYIAVKTPMNSKP